MRPARVLPLLVALLAGPAAGMDVAPDTDRALWCGSAFFWLATDAYDAGEDAEATDYEAWSEALLGTGVAALAAAGTDEATIGALLDAYDGEVLDALGTDKARFDIITCLTLAEALPPLAAPAP